MASTDTLDDVTGFAEKNKADFPILSDPTRAASESYGVLSKLGYAKRWTFYIGADGVIRHIDRKVNPATAGADLARQLATLEFESREAGEGTTEAPLKTPDG